MSSIALLFPGQGSQEKDMGRKAAEENKDMMSLWKKAEQISKSPLREIYWEGTANDMAATQWLQPALTVVNLGYWMLLSKHYSPSSCAGHSLGEYSALGAAGVLSFETILELVCLRGHLMSEADPHQKGTMVAILKLSQEQAEDCVKKASANTNELLLIANYNTPEQFVASGTQKAVGALQKIVKNAKGRAVPLAVSGAFHSPMLSDAALELEKAIQKLPKTAWSHAKFPVYPNSSPQASQDAFVLKQELCKQMTSPVYWIDSVRQQYLDGARKFIECGPKNVLTRMVASILKDIQQHISRNESQEPDWLAENVESFFFLPKIQETE